MKKDNKSKSSINLFLNTMKVYCIFAKTDLKFPKQSTIRNKENPYWTLEQLNEEIISRLSLVSNDYHEKEQLLKIMFFTGLRPNELCNLKTSDVDLVKNIIVVKNGKGDKDRTIPLTKEIYNMLCDRKTEYVFDIKYQSLCYFFKKIQRELRLGYEVTPYIMRRSFAKHCATNGLNLSVIARVMGHSNIKTTQIYVNPDDNMVKEAWDKIFK